MSEITGISSRQIISLLLDEVIAAVSACVGGDCSLSENGTLSIKPWSAGLTRVGVIFAEQYEGRKFSSWLDITTILSAIQLEQMDIPSQD